MKAERLGEILDRVVESGSVDVPRLAKEFGVSGATIRRDLKVLSAQGRLELVYGGATPLRAGDYSFRSKAERNVEAKRVDPPAALPGQT